MYLSDSVLIESIKSKSHKSFEALYKRYHRLFYNLILNAVNDKETANDISQMFWISIWTKPEVIKTDAKDSAKAFLYKHISFYIKSHFKSSYSDRIHNIEDIQISEGDKLPYSHIIEDLRVKEINRIIDKTIDKMPHVTKLIFIKLWKQGFSQEETAKKMNLSQHSVRIRHRWALEYIRKSLYKLDLEFA